MFLPRSAQPPQLLATASGPELFSFIWERRWRNFLLKALGASASGPLVPLPGPAAPLHAPDEVFLPVVRR